MYNIYHFFATLIEERAQLQGATQLLDYPFASAPLSYHSRCGFPSLILRMHARAYEPGGEWVAILDSNTYNVPAFQSHIPVNAMSIDMLGHAKATSVRKSMLAAGEVPHWIRMREVYYLLRGRNRGNTKICLVHGSFFQSMKPRAVLQEALSQALEGHLEELSLSQDQISLLERICAEAILTDQSWKVDRMTVEFNLGIQTPENHGLNILSSFHFRAIQDNTLNFIFPNYPADFHAHRRSSLRDALPSQAYREGKQLSITHPRKGDYFVFSYSL